MNDTILQKFRHIFFMTSRACRLKWAIGHAFHYMRVSGYHDIVTGILDGKT